MSIANIKVIVNKISPTTIGFEFNMFEVFTVAADTAVEVSIVVAGNAFAGKAFVKHLLNLHFRIVK